MTQVDFYILGDNSHRDINQMVCRLCEKALSQAMNVFVLTKSTEQAQQLDDLLWTYKTDSFIAHQNRLNKSDDSEILPQTEFNYPVLISSETPQAQETGQYTQLLINLTSQTPPLYQQFERIAEMVGKDPQSREVARNRYRFYLQQGLSLNKYDL